MFSPAQCRAARGLLDWSQQQLADAARVGVVTVRQFEGGAAQPRNATLEVLQRAFEAAGVEFTNGGRPGVRMTPVGVLYQLAAQAKLDEILGMKGMTSEAPKIVATAQTPWTIMKTPEGLECRNNVGLVLGSVRPAESSLTFDPDMDDYVDASSTTMFKLQNWIGAVMQRDAQRFQQNKS